MTTPRAAILNIIEDNSRFLIATHVGPDGDAVGSVAGLGWLLKNLGKDVSIYGPKPLTDRFSWLDLPAPWSTEIPDLHHVWVCILDCGDISRAGTSLYPGLDKEKTIFIDHHLHNQGFGSHDWIEQDRSSVGEMIAELALDLGQELSGPLARALYLAIATDTGFFTYGNTSPRTMELVAIMLENGLDTAALNAAILNQWTINRIHLQGMVLKDARLFFDGRVGLITIPSALFEETETTSDDCEGLINLLTRIKGVQVAVLIRENGENRFKFSLRSVGSFNVQDIAQGFDGGGHRNAAGGFVEAADMQEAQEKMLAAIGQGIGFSA